MKKYFTLLVFIACVFAIVPGFADYAFEPVCCQEAYCETPCCEKSGYYVSGFGGVNWLTMDKKHDVKATFDPGYAAALEIGYQFNSNFRLGAEVSYRRNELKHIKGSSHYYGYSSSSIHGLKMHSDALSFMANGYYDLKISPWFTPYVGLGLGYTTLKAKAKHDDFSFDAKTSGFAWQAIAGVSTEVCHNTHLGVEYRYFGARANATDQSVGLSLRYLF